MQTMDEIYQEYAQTVYRYLLSRTHDPDVAEELTQETFCQAVRTIGRYDESCKISTWLCAIAKNLLRAYLRKHPVSESLENHTLTSESAENDVLGTLGKIDLIKRLHACPEPFREILYLRIFGDLSFKEIGEIMGQTENWARVTFYRGKEKLRKELTDDESSITL